MRFGKTVLLEIVNAVQTGIATNTDISEHLRQLDVEMNEESGKLEISDRFLEERNNREKEQA